MQNERHLRFAQAARELKQQVIVIGLMVVLLWTTELVDWLIFDGGLDQYGVVPQSVDGLWGILFAPLLHGGFGHLAANTVPLAVLGWLILARGGKLFTLVTFVAVIGSGLGAWLFGGINSVHIGASGLVFGYFGFLILRAVYERSLVAMSSALVVVLLYGSLIWGVFPLVMGVSWQMHMFGFLAGALAARTLPGEPVVPQPDDEPLVVDYEDLDRYP
jgi:membrane associated rhomboid family serine protease